MTKILLTSPVHHDGALHEPGEALEMSEAQARALIDCGAARLAEEEAPEPPKAKSQAKKDAE